ncbi:hypothetical protein SGPA1_20850 [Streptomyces misionensis JCM 4497]
MHGAGGDVIATGAIQNPDALSDLSGMMLPSAMHRGGTIHEK